MQQGLRGHAADVQAGAAQGFPALDASHLHAQLAGLDRRVVTTRAAAYHHHVVCTHGIYLDR
ncbi:hypothetical protein D3C81_1951790 [compost metagenome]